MKHLYYIFAVIILFSSCTSNTIFKEPKDLIPQDQMVDLIVDMQLAVGGKTVTNLNQQRSNYMPLIYEKHGVDSARFARSNFYYSTKIDDYTRMLQTVKVRLDTLLKIHENLLREKDSIEKIKRKEGYKKVPGMENVLDSIIK